MKVKRSERLQELVPEMKDKGHTVAEECLSLRW